MLYAVYSLWLEIVKWGVADCYAPAKVVLRHHSGKWGARFAHPPPRESQGTKTVVERE